MRVFTFLLSILFSFSTALASDKPQLLKVISFQEDSSFVTQINFDKPVENIKSNVEFINQTIQVNFIGAEIPGKKSLLKVDNGQVKSVYTYQTKEGLLRSRIIYFKPTLAESFKNNVRVIAQGKSIKISIDSSKPLTPGEEDLDLPLVKPKSLDISSKGSVTKESSQDIIAFEMGKKKSNASKAKVLASLSDKKIKKISEQEESEIPVLATVKVKESKAENPYGRIITSLGLVFVLGLGVLLFIKWWSKNYRPNKMASKIQVITQHSLGPKRNLAIIRVAGETILLGVTDHNISMIKELSLMDDELPEFTPQQFSKELNKELISSSPEGQLIAEKDEFSEVGIQDAISERLKGMKIL